MKGHHRHPRRQMYKKSQESALRQAKHLGKFSRSKNSTLTNANLTLSRCKSDTLMTTLALISATPRSIYDTFLQKDRPPRQLPRGAFNVLLNRRHFTFKGRTPALPSILSARAKVRINSGLNKLFSNFSRKFYVNRTIYAPGGR